MEGKSQAEQDAHFSFDQELSPTINEPDISDRYWVKISFGSGSLQGYFVHDQCILGELEDEANRLTLEDYMFGLVITEDTFNNNFDGIVGLAYPEFAEPGVTPFFDSLMVSGILGKKVFAFHMSMNPDEEESELLLGDWDDSKYSGDLVWHNVEHKLFWSIQLDDVKVNGNSLGLCGPDSGKNCLLTPDSGTSMITFPSWAFEQFKGEYG